MTLQNITLATVALLVALATGCSGWGTTTLTSSSSIAEAVSTTAPAAEVEAASTTVPAA